MSVVLALQVPLQIAGDDVLSHNGLGAAAGDDDAADNLWASTGTDQCLISPLDFDIATDCEG